MSHYVLQIILSSSNCIMVMKIEKVLKIQVILNCLVWMLPLFSNKPKILTKSYDCGQQSYRLVFGVLVLVSILVVVSVLLDRIGISQNFGIGTSLVYKALCYSIIL